MLEVKTYRFTPTIKCVTVTDENIKDVPNLFHTGELFALVYKDWVIIQVERRTGTGAISQIIRPGDIIQIDDDGYFIRSADIIDPDWEEVK